MTEGNDNFNIQSMMNDNWDKIDSYAGLLAASLAPAYSSSSAYAVGDLCTRAGGLYECNTPIGSGGEAWNASHWTAASVKTLLAAIVTAISSLPPADHSSTATTYGKGDGSKYGHVKLSSAINSTSGTSDGVAATPAAVKSVADLIPSAISPYTSNPAGNGTASPGSSANYSRGDHIHPTDTSRAPTSHAASADTYGKGTSSNYGHVKLSDATNGTAAAASGGTAATPAAVKAVNDRLTYGSSDLTAGTSSLTTGVFYAYYT